MRAPAHALTVAARAVVVGALVYVIVAGWMAWAV